MTATDLQHILRNLVLRNGLANRKRTSAVIFSEVIEPSWSIIKIQGGWNCGQCLRTVSEGCSSPKSKVQLEGDPEESFPTRDGLSPRAQMLTRS